MNEVCSQIKISNFEIKAETTNVNVLILITVNDSIKENKKDFDDYVVALLEKIKIANDAGFIFEVITTELKRDKIKNIEKFAAFFVKCLYIITCIYYQVKFVIDFQSILEINTI